MADAGSRIKFSIPHTVNMQNRSYLEKLKDPRWQKRRLEVLEAAGWKCRDCGATETELQIHHCWYNKGAEPWEQHNGLVALCVNCHKRRQELEDTSRQSLSIIMKHATPEVLKKWHDRLLDIAVGIIDSENPEHVEVVQ